MKNNLPIYILLCLLNQAADVLFAFLFATLISIIKGSHVPCFDVVNSDMFFLAYRLVADLINDAVHSPDI